jgi:hypothetical protein
MRRIDDRKEMCLTPGGLTSEGNEVENATQWRAQ